ncbi:MAG: peptidoglycan-binding protein [Christensenellaceae bacterium]
MGEKATLNGFLEYLEQQVDGGGIYVWGAQGQSDISKEWIKSKETSPSNARRAIKLWEKRKSQGYRNIRAFDCSGLGMYYLQNLTGAYASDMTANSMKNKCEAISRSKLRRGDWVFRTYTSGSNKGKAYHIGYVADDKLNVIECKGRDDGVIKRALDGNGSGYWNAYGRPKIFASEIEKTQTSVKSDEWTVSRLLKKENPMMRGDDVKELQKRLTLNGYSCGLVDGVFGDKTKTAVKSYQRRSNLTVDGIAGEKTVKALGGVWEG